MPTTKTCMRFDPVKRLDSKHVFFSLVSVFYFSGKSHRVHFSIHCRSYYIALLVGGLSFVVEWFSAGSLVNACVRFWASFRKSKIMQIYFDIYWISRSFFPRLVWCLICKLFQFRTLNAMCNNRFHVVRQLYVRSWESSFIYCHCFCCSHNSSILRILTIPSKCNNSICSWAV